MSEHKHFDQGKIDRAIESVMTRYAGRKEADGLEGAEARFKCEVLPGFYKTLASEQNRGTTPETICEIIGSMMAAMALSFAGSLAGPNGDAETKAQICNLVTLDYAACVQSALQGTAGEATSEVNVHPEPSGHA